MDTHSKAASLVCTRCQWSNPAGTQYCQRCGEPVSPGLLRDLQSQYDTLKALDAAIETGGGQLTITELRRQVLARYTAMRAARPAAGAAAAGADVAMGVAAPVTVPLSARAQAAEPVRAPAPAAAVHHGPVFSWRAFIADQAIAVMAYLGGFLLLIATLTFEVGGWRALPDQAKLAGVTTVYLIFGLLGIGLRRVAILRTVSRVYLGVFALMTPLAALAVYLFALQAQGISQIGMVCLASAYAAIVYVALAARTRFVTYAYLGWAALLVAIMAIPAWAQAPEEWWLTAMTLTALGLLAPRAQAARRPEGIVAWLSRPAMWLSAGASTLAALIAVPLLFVQIMSNTSSQSPGGLDSSPRLAMAITAIGLTALALAWSWTLRTLGRPVRWELLWLVDWLVAAFAAMATVSVAFALGADARAMTYTLAGTALAEGVIAVAIRWIYQQRGLRVGIQALTIALSLIGALYALPLFSPNYAFIAVCAVGLTLGVLFALNGPKATLIGWGLVGGFFTLMIAPPVFEVITPTALLSATDDMWPHALWQAPSLYAALAIGLGCVGVALGVASPAQSRARVLRISVYVTALSEAGFGATKLMGHTGLYSALILGVGAIAILTVGRIERRPVYAAIPAAIMGSIGAIVFVIGSSNALIIGILAPILALAGLAVYLQIGRAYALPVNVVTIIATVAAFVRLLSPPDGLPAGLAQSPLGYGGLMALAVAALMAVAALRERSALWLIAPALMALLSVFAASDLWPLVVVTLALVAAGALCRWRRGPGWGAAWHGAALAASVFTIGYTLAGAHGGPGRSVALALVFMVVAWLVAWQERLPWLTAIAAPYALVALWRVGALPLDDRAKLGLTVALALGLAGIGALARARLGRPWALAWYGMAVAGSLLTLPRMTPYPDQAGLQEAILLVYAAVAFGVALLEDSSWAVLAPALYAAGAAFVQADGRALLPLALGLAAAAFGVSRLRGARWALPLYGAAMVAAVASSWQSQATPTFEPVALATLALAAWLLAALESRPDAILIAVIFAALAIPAAGHALDWPAWGTEMAFASLAWVVSLSGFGWARLPWLRERSGSWLASFARSPEAQTAWRDPREAGRRVSRVAALVIGAGAALGGALAPDAFATGQAQTEVVAVALLSLTGLLVFEGARTGWRVALYLAGETAALFVTWELRWFGADNPQAWILAPGSAQIIIGALLPADKRLRPPAWLGQAFSVAGALILTLPTLTQSVTEPEQSQWVYALLLASEALALTLLAVGLRNRTLALTGSALVGVAAIRGAILAVSQNLPIPLVIGVVALALMGLATWLSLRSRHTRGSGEGRATPGAAASAGEPPVVGT